MSAPVLAAYKGVASKGDAHYFNDDYNSATLSQLRGAAHPQCEWTYNYWTKPVGVPAGMKYMPMVFGHDQFKHDGSNNLTGDVYNDLLEYGRTSKHILGFNEPDGGGDGQAKISVHDAVDYWHSVNHVISASSDCFLLFTSTAIRGPGVACSVSFKCQSTGSALIPQPDRLLFKMFYMLDPVSTPQPLLVRFCPCVKFKLHRRSGRCTTPQGRQGHFWEARPWAASPAVWETHCAMQQAMAAGWTSSSRSWSPATCRAALSTSYVSTGARAIQTFGQKPQVAVELHKSLRTCHLGIFAIFLHFATFLHFFIQHLKRNVLLFALHHVISQFFCFFVSNHCIMRRHASQTFRCKKNCSN